jgi:hypothetical protein
LTATALGAVAFFTAGLPAGLAAAVFFSLVAMIDLLWVRKTSSSTVLQTSLRHDRSIRDAPDSTFRLPMTVLPVRVIGLEPRSAGREGMKGRAPPAKEIVETAAPSLGRKTTEYCVAVRCFD